MDMVAERAKVSAVHKGEFMGVPATGKKIHWTGNHIYRIADGRIAEAWSEVGFQDLLKQVQG
jgi:predicted ester cyclase